MIIEDVTDLASTPVSDRKQEEIAINKQNPTIPDSHVFNSTANLNRIFY
jgi:hypothetical protein